MMRPKPGVPANAGITRVSTNCCSAVCESTLEVRPYETTGSAFGFTTTPLTLFAAGIALRTAAIAWFTASRSTRGSVCGSKSITISAEPCVEVARTRRTDGSVWNAASSGRVTATRTRSGGRSPASATTSMREKLMRGKIFCGASEYA